MVAENCLTNFDNYGPYEDLVRKGYVTIDANDFTVENIEHHFDCVINVLCDGIEQKRIQNAKVHLIYTDGEDIEFTTTDYLFNMIFYPIILRAGAKIDSTKIWWCEDITAREIANYINDQYVRVYETTIPVLEMNQTIDSIFTKFIRLQNFQMFLANTMNMKDHTELMNKYPEFNDAVHCDASGVPIEDVKDYGLKVAYKQIDYIKNSDHCLRDSFRTGEAVSPKQFKEVYANIGTKPNGKGGVYPTIINRSFITGGLLEPEDNIIESSIGRLAQTLSKSNVGVSGNFARLLGLNCQNTRLYNDPKYSCDTQNFVEVEITDEDYLSSFDMRYYRTQKNGIDKRIDARRDKHLIGKKLFLRSPMTCNSFMHGYGICYKCYGDLAYLNYIINPGKYAAEELSSRFTQKLLSAKHLLESNIKSMEWRGPIFDYILISYDNLCLRDDIDYTGYKIRLNNIDFDDEYDDADYNYYVSSFTIITPEGAEHDIYTTDSDNIYLQPDIAIIVNKIMNNSDEDAPIELDMKELMKSNHLVLFKISIKNDELQATMNRIKNIINTKSEISKYNKDAFLREFMETNFKGGIHIASVHYEVILANQLRSGDSYLEYPDWGVPDQEDYQIVTLNDSLIESPFLMSRFLNNRIGRIFITPSTYQINRPSDNDLYAMTNPTAYMNKNPGIHTGERNSLTNDDDENISKAVNPIIEWKSREEYDQWIADSDKTTVY